MALTNEELACTAIETLEKKKFTCDSNDDIAVNVVGEFDANVTTTPSGLQTSFKIRLFEVTDTAIALPTTALTDRNSLSIRNLDQVEILYIGDSNVEADEGVGDTAGWQVGPNETVNLDIKDTIIIYGIAESGKTIKVQTFEAA